MTFASSANNCYTGATILTSYLLTAFIGPMKFFSCNFYSSDLQQLNNSFLQLLLQYPSQITGHLWYLSSVTGPRQCVCTICFLSYYECFIRHDGGSWKISRPQNGRTIGNVQKEPDDYLYLA